MADKKFVRDLNSLIRPTARKRLPGAPARAAIGAATKTVTAEVSVAQAMAGNQAELYRVVSQIVTDPTGNWEFPVGFPTTNTYPGYTGGPDQSTYLVSERTHELALIDEQGNVRYSLHPTDWEQPYTGDGTYGPAYSLIKVTTAPDGFATAWDSVVWSVIEGDLADRYPGITI